jgi:hypothetical protein
MDYTDQDFQTIYKTKSGRGGGVGLKSFNWTSLGNSSGNMFTFGAEIELFFESIEEITRVRRIDPDVTKSGKPIETSFADLIIQQLKAPGGAYNPNYYRIKALIGWNVPKNSKSGLVSNDFIEEMSDSNLSLYLSLNSHEISFEEDSSITLKLKYTAYIEALAQSPSDSNILYSDNSQYITNIGTKKEEQEKLAAQYAETPTTQLENKLKNLESEIKKIESENIESIYSRILSYIYQNKTPSGASIIKYAIVDETAFDTFTSIIGNSFNNQTTEEQIDSYNKSINSLKNKITVSISNESPTSSTDKSAAHPQNDDEVKSSLKDTMENYEKQLQGLSEKQKIAASQAKASGTVSPAYKVIPYFYLGDLLEAVLKGMYNSGKELPQKELKVLLGPLRFYDYGSLVTTGEPLNRPKNLTNSSGKTIKYYTGKSEVINIADIPISLSIYSNWFLKNIVDEGVFNMTFREFISSILNDLVLRATSVDTYSFVPRQRTRLVFKTKVLPQLSYTRFIKKAEGYRYKITEYVNSANGGPGPLIHDPNEFYTDGEKKKLENILFIYGTGDNPTDLIADYEEDIKRGIRHLYYGNETGMVKKINFKRVDNQLLRSNNIKLISSQAADKAVILREVYNADIEMFGNNIFEIGEMVYISPILFGTSKTGVDHKDRETFVKNLGIGGYYTILKINSSITDGAYDTTLSLQWIAKGDGLINDVLNTTDSNGVKII